MMAFPQKSGTLNFEQSSTKIIILNRLTVIKNDARASTK